MAYRYGGIGALRAVALIGMLIAPPAVAEDASDEPDPTAMIFFGSLEAGPGKTFVALGSKQALDVEDGLEAGGFRLMRKLGVSHEQARRMRPYGTAYKIEAQVLLGYEWRVDDNFLALYVGPDTEAEYRSVWYASGAIARASARLHADFWATPTRTTKVQASAYVSGLDRRAWGRLALGQKLFHQVYVGPEIEFYRQSDFHKLRAGLHLTGLRFRDATWRLSAGFQDESGRASGVYATLGLHWAGAELATQATRSAFRFALFDRTVRP